MSWTMPSHSWGVIAVYIPMLIAGISSFSLTAQSTNGCYGIGVAGRDFLTPSCNAGQMMAIEYIKLGAKRDDSGCPKEANAQPVSHKDNCCSYDGATSDRHCFFDFTRNQTYFAEICLGRSQCLSIANQLRVDREQTTGGVCHSDYLDYSNYMVMSYYCIPDTQRIDEDQSASRTSTRVYLHSKDYPQSKMKQRTPEQIGVCSISAAACDAKIRTSILDVRFSTGSGSCSKTVTINDGSNAVSISCNEDTLFVRENFYTSTSNFLTLDMENQVTGGIFFLEFDSDDGSQITLACGGSALRTSPTTNCTTIPPGTNTFSTATTTTEKPFEITKEGYMAMAYTFIALFLLLLCYYLLFQVVFLCYRCYKEGRFCFKTCNGVKANTVGPNGKDSMKNLPPLNHQFGANGSTLSQRNAAAHPGNSQEAPTIPSCIGNGGLLIRSIQVGKAPDKRTDPSSLLKNKRDATGSKQAIM